MGVAVADAIEVDSVVLVIDGTRVAIDTRAPWTFETFVYSSTAETMHLVSALALDTAGNQTQAETIVIYTDTTAPDSVAVEADTTAPYRETARLRVYAHDTVALSVVEVWRVTPSGTDTRIIATTRLDERPLLDTYTTFDVVWRVASESAGVHRIFAVARDRCGRQTTSATATVRVETASTAGGPVIDTITVRVFDAVLGTILPGDIVATNGDTIILTVTADAPGYAVTADFSPIDDAYRAGDEQVTDSGNGQYSIVYRISTGNERPNDVYQIPVSVTNAGQVTSTLRTVVVLERAVASAPVQVGPNPYLPGTSSGGGILFNNLEAGGRIEIFTVTGRRIFGTAVGADQIRWNVRSEDGREVPSGVYLYVAHRPTAGSQRGKVVIIR